MKWIHTHWPTARMPAHTQWNGAKDFWNFTRTFPPRACPTLLKPEKEEREIISHLIDSQVTCSAPVTNLFLQEDKVRRDKEERVSCIAFTREQQDRCAQRSVCEHRHRNTWKDKWEQLLLLSPFEAASDLETHSCKFGPPKQVLHYSQGILYISPHDNRKLWKMKNVSIYNSINYVAVSQWKTIQKAF